ncbi:guanitoxin biosynthesis L-enduracididine beta-hydroxylase GntD [Stackebrandtia soli]|uniref:guanitoxin biosynthesis L-enduracididine beta-hydroxylase GntD n=1 Tax=Stackebrandtia soli TaxID=1892856 RepID=UPI0039E8B829
MNRPDIGAPASLTLSPTEATVAADLAHYVAARFPAMDDPALLRELPLLATGLPDRVRRFLRDFSLDEYNGYCVIDGHVVDDDRIGATPEHWKGRARPGPEFAEEILLLLYGSLLGEPFGWATQQNGHFVNDVFPIREYENERLGTGSKTPLTLHTEDAFHPYRADYVMLYALRNPDHVPTIVAELDYSVFTGEDLDVLFSDRFRVVPDTSHLPKNNTIRSEADRAYFDSIEALMNGDRRASLLFGSRSAPFLRFDESYMRPADDDPEAKRVYDLVGDELRARRHDARVDAGALLILNNSRVVHGRSTFKARYDGTDRWLKRVNVTTDLRKSAEMRGRLGPRLVG